MDEVDPREDLRIRLALLGARVDEVAIDALALLERDRDDIHRGARSERAQDALERTDAVIGIVVIHEPPAAAGLGLELEAVRERQLRRLEVHVRLPPRSRRARAPTGTARGTAG